MKLVQFLAVVLTGLALVPSGAHLLALPNKIALAQDQYFIVQNIYRGWALFGAVLIPAVLANLALAFMLRGREAPFWLALLAGLCLATTLAIFFIFVFPANQATDKLDDGAGKLGDVAGALGERPRRQRHHHVRRTLLRRAFGAPCTGMTAKLRGY